MLRRLAATSLLLFAMQACTPAASAPPAAPAPTEPAPTGAAAAPAAAPAPPAPADTPSAGPAADTSAAAYGPTPIPPQPAGAHVAPGRVTAHPRAKTPAAGESDLQLAVRQIVEQPPFDRMFFGVEVYDPRSDRVLVDVNADRHFIPASNNKLLTTTAAMALLGADYRYRTEVRALGRSGSRARALVVRGSGDPTLSARFGAGDWSALDSLAAGVAASGIGEVDGPLVIDATRFDSTTVNGSWEIGDLDWYYAAPVTAFDVAEGAFTVHLAPGTPGSAARIDVGGPAGLVTVVDHVRTVRGDSADWDVHRLPGDTLLFTGTVRSTADARTSWVAMESPARTAGRALAAALEHAGVRVRGPVRVLFDSAAVADLEVRFGGPAAAAGEVASRSAPGGSGPGAAGPGEVVAVRTSPAMKEIVKGVLEPSQNWIAEHLLKTLGAEEGAKGSWREGVRVLHGFLDDSVGIDSLAIRTEDASGLSAQNLVTPAALVRLLTWVRLQPWGESYLDALASPGEHDSTLEHRLLQYRGRLFAKTGTISNVNSLSGFVVTDTGQELVFSILSNGSGLPSARVRHAIDRILQTVATDGGSR